MKVKPKYFDGWSLRPFVFFGPGPKFTITCGNCERTWRERIPMVNNPGMECPTCKAINVLPLEVEEGKGDK